MRPLPDGLVVGVDIGTSSSKGVLVDLSGRVLATAVRQHEPSRPRPGWVEMPAALWWEEFCSIAQELGAVASKPVVAVGVSGMGPCVALAEEHGEPLRPAILYGVDTRATRQVERLTAERGAEEILRRGGSLLSSQAAGPKIAWVAEHEPEVFARARRLFMPASWLAWSLTGAYVLDHQSASQCTPLYDIESQRWNEEWAAPIVGAIELPELVWADTVVGRVTPGAAAVTGLPAGIPVVSGTIDAWTEAVSVGAQAPGDLMLMYGTTMFLVSTVERPVRVPELWSTIGALEGTRSLAGGMATSGAITNWVRGLVGSPDFGELLAEAAASPSGANGLLMLPYFAGERTPVSDPDARGTVVGLTLDHTRGDLYRAALEATALGVLHNIRTMVAAGAVIDRVVAVGGGTQGGLWPQIVSDVTGLPQDVTATSIGASFGAAFLAATAVASPSIGEWNPVVQTVEPNRHTAAGYAELFELYLELYPATREIAHALAARQRTG
ncbi:FGGY-family carbohydrate kinase [soil metagenome]